MLFVACYEYTPEAWSRLLARPADRTQPVRDAMAEAGANRNAPEPAAELPDVLARARKVSERFRAPDEETAA